MCVYCGCRAFPLIESLVRENALLQEAAGMLRRAILAGDEESARILLVRLRDLLGAHVTIEEAGLFSELRVEGTLQEGVDRLCVEHAEINAVLTGSDVDGPRWPDVLAVLERLREHLDCEEEGLFPAAAIALPIDAWDRITPSAHA